MKKQYVTFKTHGQLFGIEILLVREINQLLETTYVQHAPEYVMGLVNLRGQIVTIFDLGLRLSVGPTEVGEDTHNIILKSNGELSLIRARERRQELTTSDDIVGLRVDSIGDILEVDEDDIGMVPANIGTVSARFLSGVVSLRDELLILLSTEELLRKERAMAA